MGGGVKYQYYKYKLRRLGTKLGFTISINCIDAGLKIPHIGTIVINGRCKIGKNLTIRQNSTIGNKKDGRNDLTPTIGDNVIIGANSCIIGHIKIGDNVVIGAGSVVVKDVPSNSIVAGNPAKIIRSLKEQ